MEYYSNNEIKATLYATSLQLKALHTTILSLHVALEQEHIEQQALDAMECIGFCVNDIKNSIDSVLAEQS